MSAQCSCVARPGNFIGKDKNGWGWQPAPGEEQVVAVPGIDVLTAHSAGVQALLDQGAVLAGLADAGVAVDSVAVQVPAWAWKLNMSSERLIFQGTLTPAAIFHEAELSSQPGDSLCGSPDVGINAAVGRCSTHSLAEIMAGSALHECCCLTPVQPQQVPEAAHGEAAAQCRRLPALQAQAIAS